MRHHLALATRAIARVAVRPRIVATLSACALASSTLAACRDRTITLYEDDVSATMPSTDIAVDSTAGIAAVRTTAVRYKRGDAMQLYIVNIGPTPLWANACPEALDRRTANGWTAVQDDDASACVTVMITAMARGDSARSGRILPTTIAPGEYRVRFESLARYGTGEKLDRAFSVSNGFIVE